MNTPGVIIGERCDQPKTFTLHVGNQSYENSLVDIKVWIDGTLVTDEYFHVRGQHYWKPFKLRMCPGQHEIEAESMDGEARQRFKFTIDDKADYGLLDYWLDPEENVPKSFHFDTGSGAFYAA